MHRPLLAALAPLALLLGCFEKEDNYWMPYCEESRSPLSGGEASPLGFSIEEGQTALGGAWSLPLSWASGGSVPMALELALAGEGDFVDLEPAEAPEDATVPSIYVVCDDYVEVEATLELLSDDGRIDDRFVLDLMLSAADQAQGYITLETSDFHDPSIFDAYLVASATEQGPSLTIRLGPAGAISGEIGWEAQGEDGETAWASYDIVASWSLEGE